MTGTGFVECFIPKNQRENEFKSALEYRQRYILKM